MKDETKPLNRGVLPENASEQNETRHTREESAASEAMSFQSGSPVNLSAVNDSPEPRAIPENGVSESAELELDISDEPEYPYEYRHVRSPELKRSEQGFLMSAAAVCGAVGGVILALSGKADPKALETMVDGTLEGFWSIFRQRTLIGAVFLAVEYLLGFFAPGDLLVWLSPLVYTLGVSFRITALQNWALLPSGIVGTISVIAGAVLSAGFSNSLMRLTSGGAVYIESSPKKKFTVSFLGCLAAIIAAAIYEGAILSS